jgi:hypothetical protein
VGPDTTASGKINDVRRKSIVEVKLVAEYTNNPGTGMAPTPTGSGPNCIPGMLLKIIAERAGGARTTIATSAANRMA